VIPRENAQVSYGLKLVGFEYGRLINRVWHQVLNGDLADLSDGMGNEADELAACDVIIKNIFSKQDLSHTSSNSVGILTR
jgi:hypothetical protein